MSSKSLCIAIETASRVSSVAVLEGDRFTEISQDAPTMHSETLLPQLETALELSKVPRGAVELIAVSIGPGSFTGLRIGLATAKALSYAWSVPIVGVPTLEALAYHYPFDRVLTMLDAQKNCAYYQFFDRLKATSDVRVGAIDEIMGLAAAFEGKVIAGGDAIRKIKEAPSNVEVAPMNLRMPRAVNVGLCARRLAADGLIDNVMNLEPKYVRRSEAEVLWEKRHPSSD
ncbi:MAG: tRNA (adenosine(37)-N6)-threonylcarbamoyltransferase complex dimerization subunit type 1 TsaB [Selenomonadaceae bacterium]|nr:tRNA (adenosine(37)-N6)-threonylcarbamoyltransferase complex dimerization subunit type 1 TsaB [Selenomonadaceae bacterium]